MTLTGLVVRNALRNQRRTVPTILSIGFSMLLLTIMMTLWRTSTSMNWARPQLSACLPGPHVFFSYAMPNDYREKNRSVPGAVAVAPLNIFNKVDKDNKAENAFPQGGTDPDEFLKVCRDDEIPQDQVIAWQKDRAGTIVEDALAWQQGWKLGDRIVIQGKFFPVNLELEVGSGPGDALKSIKEQLRAIPNRGVGYGILRYLAEGDGLPASRGRRSR